MRKAFAACLIFPLVLTFSMFFVAPFGTTATAAPGGERGMGLLLSRPDERLVGSPMKYRTQRVLASSVDLSADIPPIGDQGQQGSCVGWSSGYYLKTWWEKQEHPDWDLNNQMYVFSPSYIYNQININGMGAYVQDALQLLEEQGDVDIAEFPYYDYDYSAEPSTAQREEAKQYRAPNNWGFFFAEDYFPQPPYYPPYSRADVINNLKAWLDSGKPLGLSIPIYEDWPSYGGNPSSEFYDYDGGSGLDGGHAVFIAGYDDSAGGGQGGFLMINSWGPKWNGNGRVYLSYDFVQRYVPEGWYIEDQDSSPSISGVSPSSGGPGDTVTVSGNNFGGLRRSARVDFAGGTSGSVTSWVNDRIKVKVPSGAATGELHVYDWDSERSNGNPFEVGPSNPEEATGWLFAEGATWPGFDEWVLVQNPNSEASAVSVTFFTPRGRVNGPNFSVPGQSRYNVHVNEFVPDQDVATSVSVTNGVPVCAERAMYVSTSDGKWGAHDSSASPAAAGVWYLAEGATWPGFDEWILVMNPNSSPVSVRLTFQTSKGNVSGPSLNLAGFTRGTVHVNDHIPQADVSTTVTCTTPGKGVVAERSMYINTPDGRRGCHNSMGLNEANSGWGLAEGATWEGFEEWVLVQNPTDVPANVRFYFLTPYGYMYGPEGTVCPGTRLSVRVNDYIPYSDVSTMVFTESEDAKVVVERAMYINTPDGKRGAHDATGSEYASTSWYLPEGCTLPGFDEWVLVVNPDARENVFVQLTFMTQGGPVKGPSGILPPATRATCHVNDFVRGSVSTKVESEGYVVCERAMYMNTFDGKGGATDSLGVLASSLDQTVGSSVAGRGTKDEQVLKLRPMYLQK